MILVHVDSVDEENGWRPSISSNDAGQILPALLALDLPHPALFSLVHHFSIFVCLRHISFSSASEGWFRSLTLRMQFPDLTSTPGPRSGQNALTHPHLKCLPRYSKADILLSLEDRGH